MLPNFIKYTKDDAEIDFTKIDGFDKLKREGVFGIDIFGTVDLLFESCKDGFLTFSYRFIWIIAYLHKIINNYANMHKKTWQHEYSVIIFYLLK